MKTNSNFYLLYIRINVSTDNLYENCSQTVTMWTTSMKVYVPKNNCIQTICSETT